MIVSESRKITTMVTHSEAETIARGEEVAKLLTSGDVLAFYGDLGTGKTHFIQGICRGLGVKEHVASPTFTIVNEYSSGEIPIYHFDFYRMKSMDEIRDIGFEEYVSGPGISLIEWAEKAEELLPPGHYEIRLQLGVNEYTRAISMNIPATRPS